MLCKMLVFCGQQDSSRSTDSTLGRFKDQCLPPLCPTTSCLKLLGPWLSASVSPPHAEFSEDISLHIPPTPERHGAPQIAVHPGRVCRAYFHDFEGIEKFSSKPTTAAL